MTDDQTHSSGTDSLHRSCSDRMVAGVAGGLAEHLGIDPALVRLGFVALTVLGGAGVPLYGAAWLLLPEACSGQSVLAQMLGRHRVA